MDAGDGEVVHLNGTEAFVRVARRHKKGFVDFETPGAALNGAVGGKMGEISIVVEQSVGQQIREDILKGAYLSIENSILAL